MGGELKPEYSPQELKALYHSFAWMYCPAKITADCADAWGSMLEVPALCAQLRGGGHTVSMLRTNWKRKRGRRTQRVVEFRFAPGQSLQFAALTQPATCKAPGQHDEERLEERRHVCHLCTLKQIHDGTGAVHGLGRKEVMHSPVGCYDDEKSIYLTMAIPGLWTGVKRKMPASSQPP